MCTRDKMALVSLQIFAALSRVAPVGNWPVVESINLQNKAFPGELILNHCWKRCYKFLFGGGGFCANIHKNFSNVTFLTDDVSSFKKSADSFSLQDETNHVVANLETAGNQSSSINKA